MARFWSIFLLLLLALPIAAPATAPVPDEARWDNAAALIYRARAGDTLAGLADRALGDPGRLALLAGANALKADAKLQEGQKISIPYSMLKKDMLTARVTSFAGTVTTGEGLALAVGNELREGDIISTGAGSYVTLDMGPAGRVTLPSQTRVQIAALHRVALTGAIKRRLEPVETETLWLAARRAAASAGNRGG